MYEYEGIFFEHVLSVSGRSENAKGRVEARLRFPSLDLLSALLFVVHLEEGDQ